jgi:hypothetical protein
MGYIRTIKCSKEQFIGRGSYSIVFRINEHQVVKTAYGIGDLMREEYGSREPDACRIDEIVRVITPQLGIRWGMVKPYIPIKVPEGWICSSYGREQRAGLKERNPKLAWDLHFANCRFMPDGQIVIIDTMVDSKCCPGWLFNL